MTGEGRTGEPHPFAKARRDRAEVEVEAAMQVLAAQTRRDHCIADLAAELANLARGASIFVASKLPEGKTPQDTKDFRAPQPPEA